ncbi:hypothetical protein MNV_1710003 [Candidatus Methanoperedens nitroreducens]|uniref:Uncharacterized protein n=1 Tax=Candidatus Methanoperedens nitratireducens TaxID=1392998 RepID=A0A284VLS7_9EURY|nr:hypothetical protein MNV_1710003 [Candidatus Methanoperedens nitroreducens]
MNKHSRKLELKIWFSGYINYYLIMIIHIYLMLIIIMISFIYLLTSLKLLGFAGGD